MDTGFMGSEMVRAATVMVLAASPVVELRGSIPLAIGAFGMPVTSAVFLSVIGNLFPTLAVYGLGKWWLRVMDGHKGRLRLWTDMILRRSRRTFRGRYERYGLLALPFFVGLPLPMTGAWTGSIAAFLFGIPFRKCFPLVIVGVLMAAAIVTLITTGVLSSLSFILL
ncbi:hypothetical protein AMJ57_02080 [Parcubacteria bacterium SG8_24]|nr:MAG: hypothetical protein AMJ57_02080 [Parcubacteria bacterium SG8_24]